MNITNTTSNNTNNNPYNNQYDNNQYMFMSAPSCGGNREHSNSPRSQNNYNQYARDNIGNNAYNMNNIGNVNLYHSLSATNPSTHNNTNNNTNKNLLHYNKNKNLDLPLDHNQYNTLSFYQFHMLVHLYTTITPNHIHNILTIPYVQTACNSLSFIISSIDIDINQNMPNKLKDVYGKMRIEFANAMAMF